MNHSSQPRIWACLSCLVLFLIGNMVSAQVVYSGYTPVDSSFINTGKKQFKNHVKNSKEMTEEISVSYATLKALFEKADSTDYFVFTIVGIDKHDKEDLKIWPPLFGVPDLKDYDKHQGLIFGIIPTQNTGAPNPPRYFAMGKLCPPPVCPSN